MMSFSAEDLTRLGIEKSLIQRMTEAEATLAAVREWAETNKGWATFGNYNVVPTHREAAAQEILAILQRAAR